MQLAQLDFYKAAQQQNLPGVPDNVGNASDRGFGELLGGILSGVMIVAALLLLFFLLWGALDWITSGGDSGKITKARDKMTQSVIGMIVLAAALAIFFVVQSYLGLDILRLRGTPGSQVSPQAVPDSGSIPNDSSLPQEPEGGDPAPLLDDLI